MPTFAANGRRVHSAPDRLIRMRIRTVSFICTNSWATSQKTSRF